MAYYETDGEIQKYVNVRVQRINALIQDLPDISGFEDVIEKISDVSTYMSCLASNTNKEVSDDLAEDVRYLSNYLSGIETNVTNLKGNVVTLRSKLITINSDTSEDEEIFLMNSFPIITD